MIKKILVSQPAPSSDKSPYFDLAERNDLELTFKPFIRIEGISTRETSDSLKRLSSTYRNTYSTASARSSSAPPDAGPTSSA